MTTSRAAQEKPTSPRTEAGRDALHAVDMIGEALNSDINYPEWRKRILAIEREAAADLYRRQSTGPTTHGPPDWFELHESAKEIWRDKAATFVEREAAAATPSPPLADNEVVRPSVAPEQDDRTTSRAAQEKPTSPRTEAGRAFARRIGHFNIIGDIADIIEVEREAAAATPSHFEGHGKNRVYVLADPAATPSLDVERLAAAIYNCDLANPVTFHIGTVDREAARIAAEYTRLARLDEGSPEITSQNILADKEDTDET